LSHEQQFAWVIKTPLHFIQSVLGLIGSPLAFWGGSTRAKIAPVLGAMAIAIGFAQIVFAWKNGQIKATSPFVALFIFGNLYCVLVALGRAPNGYNYWLLTSRYTSGALLIPVAILGLGWIMQPEDRSQRYWADESLLFQLLPALFVILVVSGTPEAVKLSRQASSARRFAASIIPIVNLFDPAVDGVRTGPFFALMPVEGGRFLQWGIGGAIAKSRLPRLQNPSSELVEGTVRIKSDVLPKMASYLDHRVLALGISGSVEVPIGLEPKILLLKKSGESNFLTAAPLKPTFSTKGDRKLYTWQVLVSPELDSLASGTFEASLYDPVHSKIYELSDIQK
jgi:hypothetical protein